MINQLIEDADRWKARTKAAEARAEAAEAKVRELVHEIEVLRIYGNKDCTAMADDFLMET